MIELSNGTLYMMEPNGNQLELGNISNGLIEMDTLSADETPNIYYSFTKDISASLEVSIRDVSFLDEFTIKQPLPKETFNIEHNTPILVQARWHKKKRINKKWLKRYGMKSDTVKMRAKARTLSYDTETGECEFELDKIEYIWRPDQLRKNLKIEIKTNPFSGKTLCVTGRLEHFTRDSINAKIAELGAKAAGSVSKSTDYLITNEQSGSSKYKKAVELNIPIISESEFLAMIGE